MNPKQRLLPILILQLVLLTAACKPIQTQVDSPTQQITLLPSDTQSPPTSQPFSQVILWVPEGSDPSLAGEISGLVIDQSAGSSKTLTTVPTLTQNDLREGVEMVIALAPATGIQDLALANPGIDFLVIAVSGIQPGSNLSVIPSSTEMVKPAAFMAGYLSALVTVDYRVGVLSVTGNDFGIQAVNSFITGIRYYCGLCGAKYAPFIYYPVSSEIGDPSNETMWQAAANALVAQGVQVVYISPEAYSEPLVSYLAEKDVRIIASATLPAGLNPDKWLATLSFDYRPALQAFWDGSMDNSQGSLFTPEITLSNLAPGAVTEGKLRLFNATYAEMKAGYISISPMP